MITLDVGLIRIIYQYISIFLVIEYENILFLSQPSNLFFWSFTIMTYKSKGYLIWGFTAISSNKFKTKKCKSKGYTYHTKLNRMWGSVFVIFFTFFPVFPSSFAVVPADFLSFTSLMFLDFHLTSILLSFKYLAWVTCKEFLWWSL